MTCLHKKYKLLVDAGVGHSWTFEDTPSWTNYLFFPLKKNNLVCFPHFPSVFQWCPLVLLIASSHNTPQSVEPSEWVELQCRWQEPSSRSFINLFMYNTMQRCIGEVHPSICRLVCQETKVTQMFLCSATHSSSSWGTSRCSKARVDILSLLCLLVLPQRLQQATREWNTSNRSRRAGMWIGNPNNSSDGAAALLLAAPGCLISSPCLWIRAQPPKARSHGWGEKVNGPQQTRSAVPILQRMLHHLSNSGTISPSGMTKILKILSESSTKSSFHHNRFLLSVWQLTLSAHVSLFTLYWGPNMDPDGCSCSRVEPRANLNAVSLLTLLSCPNKSILCCTGASNHLSIVWNR